MDFGRTYRVVNFTVRKHTRALGSKELRVLRNENGIMKEHWRHLQRQGMPYITVEAGSGIWAVRFCCNTQMYMVLDTTLANATDADLAALAHMFGMWFTDTTVMGDEPYIKAKATAMKEYMDRIKAKEVTQEEDDKVLDEVRKDEESKATVLDMAKEIERLENGRKENDGQEDGEQDD